VHWGFYSSTLSPSLTVASGTTVTVEMLTHHAGDYYDGMIAGDAGVESVYDFYSAGIGSGSKTPGKTPVTETASARAVYPRYQPPASARSNETFSGSSID
jgi:hypothetical protein